MGYILTVYREVTPVREYLDTRSIGRSLRDIQQQLYEVDKIIYKANSPDKGKRTHVFKRKPLINILNNNVG